MNEILELLNIQYKCLKERNFFYVEALNNLIKKEFQNFKKTVSFTLDDRKKIQKKFNKNLSLINQIFEDEKRFLNKITSKHTKISLWDLPLLD